MDGELLVGRFQINGAPSPEPRAAGLVEAGGGGFVAARWANDEGARVGVAMAALSWMTSR